MPLIVTAVGVLIPVIVFDGVEVLTVFNSDAVTMLKSPKASGSVSVAGAGVFIVKVPCTQPIVTVTTVLFGFWPTAGAAAAIPVAVTVPPFTTLITLTVPPLALTTALSPSPKPAI